MLHIHNAIFGLLVTSIVTSGIACSDVDKTRNSTVVTPNAQTISLLDNIRDRRRRRRQERQNNQNRNVQPVNTGFEVNPQSTDPNISDWLDSDYVVVNQQAKLRNKLFIFLPGSFGKPSRQQLITQSAAKYGYHAINLSYPNTWTVGGLCRRSSDPDCTGKIRREIIEGKDYSPLVNISAANSINNRLVKLLKYLHQKYPQQNWGQYLDGNTIKWESVVVSGHSQGGGHAAMIGKINRVARVVILGAPTDDNPVSGDPAPWLATPGQTPPERYYGFSHIKDQGYQKILTSWKLLGMTNYGQIVNVDTKKPPYNNSRTLVTTLTPSRRNKYHGSVATDQTTPKRADGTPIFEDVWQYLFNL